MAYSREARLVFVQRLGGSWSELAIWLEIPDHTRDAFPHGREPDQIWRWMAERKRLDRLPEALDAVNRADLAAELRRRPAPEEPIGRPARRRLRVAAGVGAAVLVTTVGVLVIKPWETEGDPGARPSGSGTSGAGAAKAPALSARIVKTSGDAVMTYADPTEQGRGPHNAAYAEGDDVLIRCQLTDGREVTDSDWGNQNRATRLWYRLDHPDEERWVPSLYVELLNGVPAAPDCGR